MGCNCTSNNKALKKYTDDGQGGEVKLTGMRKVARFFGNLALFVMALAVVVMMTPIILPILLARAIIFRKANTFSIHTIWRWFVKKTRE